MRIPTELNISIGKRITLLRKENGLRQEDLAEKLDVSTKHMSEVERGLTCLSIERLIALCDILSTDLDYLVRGIDRRTTDTAAVPGFILELFNSDDKTQQELLRETLLLFKKTYDHKQIEPSLPGGGSSCFTHTFLYYG